MLQVGDIVLAKQDWYDFYPKGALGVVEALDRDDCADCEVLGHVE